MIPRLSSILPSLIAAPILCFAACGGGSSGGTGGPGAASFALHLDTAAGGSDVLSARVAAVVFEAADGTLSSNLLPQPVDVTLVDPAGETSGLALLQPTQTGSVAVHLMVQGGVASALRTNGSNVAVTLPSNDLRIPITGAFAPAADAALTITHAGAPALLPAGAGLNWTPAFSARVASDVVLSSSNAFVASIDRAKGTLVVQVPGYQNLSFDLTIPASSRLVGDDGGTRSRDQFLAECQSGSTLSFEALSTTRRSLSSHSAHHRGRTRGEAKFLGRITSIDAGSTSFRFDVQAQRTSAGYGPSTFTNLTVDATTAVIYTSHHSVRTSAGFSDLTVAMLVEVEGSTPSNDSMRAREVEIEDGSGSGGGSGGGQSEIEGRVTSVNVVAGTIEVGRRGDDPLLVGGVSVTSATITIGASTAIYRRGNSGLETIQLGAITSADRIWIRGTVTGPGAVNATWVRVEVD